MYMPIYIWPYMGIYGHIYGHIWPYIWPCAANTSKHKQARAENTSKRGQKTQASEQQTQASEGRRIAGKRAGRRPNFTRIRLVHLRRIDPTGGLDVKTEIILCKNDGSPPFFRTVCLPLRPCQSLHTQDLERVEGSKTM